jgi:hypothetical protein
MLSRRQQKVIITHILPILFLPETRTALSNNDTGATVEHKNPDAWGAVIALIKIPTPLHW